MGKSENLSQRGVAVMPAIDEWFTSYCTRNTRQLLTRKDDNIDLQKGTVQSVKARPRFNLSNS